MNKQKISSVYGSYLQKLVWQPSCELNINTVLKCDRKYNVMATLLCFDRSRKVFTGFSRYAKLAYGDRLPSNFSFRCTNCCKLRNSRTYIINKVNPLFLWHDSFAAVNTAAIASKMTIAAVNQACHRCH